jgi:peptidoglycan hydrolase-like protein with peptidoglycan-binding domain
MRVLRPKDTGDDVGLLQYRLIRAGAQISVTHAYDNATSRAVRALQAKHGLVDDGIAGPLTLTALLLDCGRPAHIVNDDIAQAASLLNVDISSVRAVRQVESRNCGFLEDNRPIILFERHVFWQRLQAHGLDPARYEQGASDVLSQTRGGYAGGSAEYDRLQRAEAIEVSAAWESSSWGAFQIMGEHWKRLGYRSAAEFVAHMETSEHDQLDAFVRFVRADKHLLDTLRARNWPAFACAYNGRAFHDNLYDTKLADAYGQFASKDWTA